MSRAPAPDAHVLRGIVLTILAFLCLAVISALAKTVSRDVSSGMLVVFQYGFGLVLLLPWLLSGGIAGLRTRRPALQLVWAVFGLASQYLLFVALRYISLVDAVLLANTSPLFIPLIVRLWVGTPIGRRLWLSLLIGFVGIVLILQPGSGVLSRGTLLALASGVCSAIGLVAISRLEATEPARRMLLYYFLMSTALAAPLGVGAWSPPGVAAWIALLAIGVCMALAQGLTILAYAHAPPERLAPFNYSVVVFSALIGWVVWHETPNVLALVGVILVCVGGILSTRHPAARAVSAAVAPTSLRRTAWR